LNRPGIQFLKPACDLNSPRLFGALVNFVVKAVDERVSECRPGCRRKFERLCQQLSRIVTHVFSLAQPAFAMHRERFNRSDKRDN
jgi:hypothetical protein